MAIDVVVDRAAGLDIAKASLVACVRTPAPDSGWKIEKRRFAATTGALLQLAGWLAERAVTRVGMESTGDYWKPVFYLLESQFECWLLNARHMRTVPGRKTDMSDAQWICDLVAHGLVRPSFVPPPPIRRLRDLTRRRGILIAERSREKQRMEKLLEDAGVKLSVVATDIFGRSGRAILHALIAGERDSTVLAEHARGRMRSKIPALVDALVGRFTDHHAFLADMSRFTTAAHLASWAGLCPGNNKTGGKAKPSHTRPGNPHLKSALGTAALGAIRTRDSYPHAQFRRIAARRGGKRATTAVAHTLLTTAWHLLTTNTTYQDPGAEHFLQLDNPQRRQRRALATLERLGYHVTLQPRTTVT